MLDKSIDIGTDGASFFVFHPDDLAHRRDAPGDWYMYEFACRKEFAAGRLIAFVTGADGGYRIRFTDGPLTPEEQEAAAGSWVFPFAVQHGRVYLDNGDALPSADMYRAAEESSRQWIEIPNGQYKVTLQAIDRGGTDEDEDDENPANDDLPDYVLLWQPTDAPLPSLMQGATPPRLEPFKDEEPHEEGGYPADGFARAENSGPLRDAYLFLRSESFVVPGFGASLAVSEATLGALWGKSLLDDAQARNGSADAEELSDEDKEEIVVSPSAETPALAALARVNGMSHTPGEGGRVNLTGKRLVRIVERVDAPGRFPRVRVEPIERDETALSPEELGALKNAFAQYARTNSRYSETVPHAAFEEERIPQMTSGAALTARLIHLLVPSTAERAALLPLSDSERARRLIRLLNESAL